MQDKTITFIYKHPTIPNKIYAGALINRSNTDPLFISNDGGINWIAANNAPETFSNIVARPNNPNHLYAGTFYGFDFMVSTDSGDNWVYNNNGSGGAVGYPVNLAFLPSNSNQLFYGSENPLDEARIDRYDINATDPTQLDNWTIIVDNSVWSNKRPNKLHTYSYTDNYLYVGQEGGFSKVNLNNINDLSYIYNSNGEPKKPYSYIYGHWTDPNDINHLVFGGNLNGDNTGLMQLYETYNEGTTFHRYTNTFGVSAPMIRDIVEINSDKLAVIIDDQNNDQVKLIVMEPSTLSIDNNISLQETITISPNPTNDYITITQYENKEMTINIFNCLGQIIKSKKQTSNNNVDISMKKISRGVYFVQINIIRLLLKKLFLNKCYNSR